MFSQICPVQLFRLSVRPNYIFFIALSILGIEKRHDDIINGAVQAVREHLGPVIAFKSAVIVPQLPKVNCKLSYMLALIFSSLIIYFRSCVVVLGLS